MGIIILDHKANEEFKVNLKAISKVTEQLKVSAEANNPKKAKGKKQKHNCVSNF